MNNILLISILVILIILSSIYLINKNLQQQNSLENFDNNRNSLSTFYQNTVDSDDYKNNRNLYNYKNIPNIDKNSGWNGYWKSLDNTLNGYFFQNNDKIIIYINNDNLNSINIADVSNLLENEKNSNNKSCPANTFLAVGQLNNDKNYFYINDPSKILCANITNYDLTFNQTLTGKLEKNSDIMKIHSQSNKTRPILFKKYRDFDYNQHINSYLQHSYFLNPFPNTISNSIHQIENYCPQNTYPCNDNNLGLKDVHFTENISNPSASTKINEFINNRVNACSNIGVNLDNSCKLETTADKDLNCVFNINPININGTSIPVCPNFSNSTKYHNNLNFMYQYPLENLGGTLCEYTKYFNPSYCNTFILSYITNLGDVKSLNYQYFDAGSAENNLTGQYDLWYDYLNNSSTGILYKYRNEIINDPQISKSCLNGLSFTNLDPSDLNICSKLSSFINNFNNMGKPDSSHSNLFPALWNINISKLSNSCAFTLNTYSNYDSIIKYATFNNNNINFSLNSDGIDQQLFFENVNLINTSPPNIYDSNLSNVYVAVTANIRTSKGMYLIPNTSSGAFNSSITIGLSNKPDLNGKWFIFGFMIRGAFDNRIIKNISTIDLTRKN